MKIGLCVATHIGDIDYIVRAESLGYESAWFADSQMLWSDCYATLALAADRTSRIGLGTGVAVTGTRPPPVTASSIATINALAPGRTFLGVGSGNTAMRVMGRPPERIADFERYLQELRPLLRGEEGSVELAGESRPIRHLMPDHGFVNFEDPIPLHVSGFGPRSLGLVGAHGDGAIVSLPSEPAVLERFWEWIGRGAEASGRSIDRSRFPMTALTAMSVLDDGEAVDSPRVRAECGPMAIASVHFAYDQWRNFGKKPPALFRSFWDDYCAMLADVPEERRHQRVHAGHNCWVVPEEEAFVTRELIEATCLVGPPDQLVERIEAFARRGLDRLILLPGFEPRYAVLERIARDVLPRLAPDRTPINGG